MTQARIVLLRALDNQGNENQDYWPVMFMAQPAACCFTGSSLSASDTLR